jgi:hypothetical protein
MEVSAVGAAEAGVLSARCPGTCDVVTLDVVAVPLLLDASCPQAGSAHAIRRADAQAAMQMVPWRARRMYERGCAGFFVGIVWAPANCKFRSAISICVTCVLWCFRNSIIIGCMK